MTDRYESRATTHADNCWSWGTAHYGCAVREIERLRAEVERLRTDGASAVRWAPSSAYWSEVLVKLFGSDARKGIDVLERRWQAALERADTADALLRQALEGIELHLRHHERGCVFLDEIALALRERLGKGMEQKA